MRKLTLKQFIDEQSDDTYIWVYEIDGEEEVIMSHGNKKRLLDGVQIRKYEYTHIVSKIEKYSEYVIVKVIH